MTPPSPPSLQPTPSRTHEKHPNFDLRGRISTHFQGISTHSIPPHLSPWNCVIKSSQNHTDVLPASIFLGHQLYEEKRSDGPSSLTSLPPRVSRPAPTRPAIHYCRIHPNTIWLNDAQFSVQFSIHQHTHKPTVAPACFAKRCLRDHTQQRLSHHCVSTQAYAHHCKVIRTAQTHNTALRAASHFHHITPPLHTLARLLGMLAPHSTTEHNFYDAASCRARAVFMRRNTAPSPALTPFSQQLSSVLPTSIRCHHLITIHSSSRDVTPSLFNSPALSKVLTLAACVVHNYCRLLHKVGTLLGPIPNSHQPVFSHSRAQNRRASI